jgi:DivIVA domain-containing protein
MGPDANLTPELIQAKNFTSAFRGFDQVEVKSYLARLADEIGSLRARCQQLESAVQSAEERAARPPVLDEDTLMAAVGEETASILRTARAAAGDMRTKAADDAEKILQEARAQGDRIREEASLALTRETRAAEEAALRILAAAKSEAAEMLEKVRIEADQIRAKAEQDRILTIDGANATRDRILEDLGRRRRVATVQIEQLRAGRERLIESYAVVRRTLEEVQSELGRADAEARAAADEVGQRLRNVAEPTLTEERRTSEEGTARDRGAGRAPVPESPPRGETILSGGTEGGGRKHTVDRTEGRVENSAEADQAEVDTDEAAAGEAEDEAEADLIEPDLVEADEPEPDESAAPADAEIPAAVSVEGMAGSAVDELFAKIRFARPEEEPAGVPDEPGNGGDVDESLLQRRESAVIDLEVTLTRKLKRALQDEQNDLLDRLRGLRGEPTPSRLLPDVEYQVARYVDAARPLVEQAALAGTDFARQILGDVVNLGAPNSADLATEVAVTIVEALRRRLEQAITMSADEDQAVLVESVGAAYREWKSQRIERVAGDVLGAAFSRGTWHAVPDGGSLRWVVEDTDGPCPDCDDDALAGTIPKGEEFPTGQHYPPAHSGCRCLLVPVPG